MTSWLMTSVQYPDVYRLSLSPVVIFHVAKYSSFSLFLFEGNYHTTKIWEFRMRHHCGCQFVIVTDPKNSKYVVVEGAREKVCTRLSTPCVAFLSHIPFWFRTSRCVIYPPSVITPISLPPLPLL